MLFGSGRIPDYIFVEKQNMEKIAQRISISRDEPFREPDIYLDGYAIWYGPAGVDGDVATEVERIDFGRFNVAEYQDTTGYFDVEQDPSILKTSAYADLSEIVENYSVTEEELEDDDLLAIRWAARAGVDAMANNGGEEEFVDELPQ